MTRSSDTAIPTGSRSPRAVLQKATGLAGVGLLASVLALPTSVLLARWFGPRDYGRGQWVVLVYGYASLLRTGAFDGGSRAFVHHRHRGDLSAAVESQNLGVSIDTAFSVVPGVLLAFAALAVGDPLRQLGLLLAPVAVLANSLAGYMAGLHLVREEFRRVIQISAIRSLTTPAAFIVGAVTFGAPALFLAPIALDLLTIALYALLGTKLNLGPRFDRRSSMRLLRSGFPLGLLAVVYWAYRLIGSTSIAVTRSAATLGIYAFAVAPVTVLARVVASLQAVMMPSVWGSIAVEPPTKWRSYGVQLTLMIAVVAAVATNLGQAFFPPLVHLVAPRFRSAIPIFEILAGDVLLLSIATVPSLVLDAESIGRQGRHLAIWSAGLAVNAAANTAVLLAGWGSAAVAWNDLWVQVIVVAVIFETAKSSFGRGWRRAPLYSALGAIGTLTTILAVTLHLMDNRATQWSAAIAHAAVRTTIVVVPWALVLAIARRSRHLRHLVNGSAAEVTE